MHIIKIHYKVYVLDCPLCSEKFQYKGKRATHLRKVHGVEERRTGNEVQLLEAQTSHECAVCFKRFVSKLAVNRHVNINHTFQMCSVCNKMFIVRKIKRHMYEVHGSPMPTCGICGYVNEKQSMITKHQRKVHMKERNVQCPFCDFKFFYVSDLTKHMVKHKTEKNFECNFCHKKFPRKMSLLEHIKIHTGEKKYVCSLCDEKFVQKTSLNYHVTKHHPEAV